MKLEWSSNRDGRLEKSIGKITKALSEKPSCPHRLSPPVFYLSSEGELIMRHTSCKDTVYVLVVSIPNGSYTRVTNLAGPTDIVYIEYVS